MMIEIQNPELEALIHERMQSGQFEDIEAVLMQALSSSSGTVTDPLPKNGSHAMGSLLVEAMQTSPYKDTPLESPGVRSTVRDFVL